mmetsp:Transcript_1016/g.2313  ORF Transcript_1016/g.2313 Transcript_1016/m.2313 type:complete len:86 (+) Transcript_1016:2645-2902(+)
MNARLFLAVPVDVFLQSQSTRIITLKHAMHRTDGPENFLESRCCYNEYWINFSPGLLGAKEIKASILGGFLVPREWELSIFGCAC